jgi:hypothetical protein
MKYPKTQKGNPRALTIRQHVFPVQSLKRFANSLGWLSVRRTGERPGVPLRLRADNPMFCAMRAWDQRTESGLMKWIEDEFQPIADDIVNGRLQLHAHEHKTIARFYALWRVRAQHRESPIEGRRANEITPEPLNVDQQECLERNGYIFVGPDGMLPGRMLAGIHIQREIDFFVHQLSNETWGVVRARAGEFLLPDCFGETAIVPVTPRACLVARAGNGDLKEDGVREFNVLAASSCSRYVVARSFAKCPL